MRIGVPKEIKVHEYRVGMTPASVREAVAHGHEVLVEHDAAARQGITDDDYARAGAKVARRPPPRSSPSADLIVKVKEPQPAGMRHAARGPDALHLPAPGARPRAGQGADGLGRHGHRLRDGDERARRPAAAGADERGRRPHGDPGRRALPGDGAGRARHAARRRRRRGARQGRRARRRRVRRQRRAHGDRARGAGDRARHQRRPALRHRPAVRRRRQHHLLHAPGGRGLRARGRSRHRRGAGAGRGGAQAHHRAAGQAACKRGSVLVDISIDQGGCSETSRPTTHADPTYVVARRRALLRRPTCRARWRAPPPSRSTTPRCPSFWRWPTRAPRPP